MRKVSKQEARQRGFPQIAAFRRRATANLSSTLKKMQGAVQSLQEVSAELQEVATSFGENGQSDFQRQATMAAKYLQEIVSSDAKLVQHVLQLGHIEQEQRKQDLTQNAPQPKPPEVPAVEVKTSPEDKKAAPGAVGPGGEGGKFTTPVDSPEQKQPERSKDKLPNDRPYQPTRLYP